MGTSMHLILQTFKLSPLEIVSIPVASHGVAFLTYWHYQMIHFQMSGYCFEANIHIQSKTKYSRGTERTLDKYRNKIDPKVDIIEILSFFRKLSIVTIQAIIWKIIPMITQTEHIQYDLLFYFKSLSVTMRKMKSIKRTFLNKLSLVHYNHSITGPVA